MYMCLCMCACGEVRKIVVCGAVGEYVGEGKRAFIRKKEKKKCGV